jgi:hypothetical protein
MNFEIGETRLLSSLKRKAFESFVGELIEGEGIKKAFERFRIFQSKVNQHIRDGITFGDALAKVCREESPTEKADQKLLEAFSIWLTFENIMVLMPQEMPLANLSLVWNVKYQWIKEVYNKGLEVFVRAVIGSQRYCQAKEEQRKHLKSLFSEVLSEHMTVKEFKSQAEQLTDPSA